MDNARTPPDLLAERVDLAAHLRAVIGLTAWRPTGHRPVPMTRAAISSKPRHSSKPITGKIRLRCPS
jgi:hypothetical protein